MLYRAERANFISIPAGSTEVEASLSGDRAVNQVVAASKLKTPKSNGTYLSSMEMTSTPKTSASILPSRLSTPAGGTFSTPLARINSSIFAAPTSPEAVSTAPMSYSTPLRKQTAIAPKQVLGAKPTSIGAKRAFVSLMLKSVVVWCYNAVKKN